MTPGIKLGPYELLAPCRSIRRSITPASNPENSPTLTISPTRAGMILGTAPLHGPRTGSRQNGR